MGKGVTVTIEQLITLKSNREEETKKSTLRRLLQSRCRSTSFLWFYDSLKEFMSKYTSFLAFLPARLLPTGRTEDRTLQPKACAQRPKTIHLVPCDIGRWGMLWTGVPVCWGRVVGTNSSLQAMTVRSAPPFGQKPQQSLHYCGSPHYVASLRQACASSATKKQHNDKPQCVLYIFKLNFKAIAEV